MRLLLSFLIVLACSLSCPAEETPREFVRRFYTAYKTWQIRGVPLPVHEGRISQFCGIEIIRVFRRVNEQSDDYERKFPQDPANPTKPPWCQEGDVFCNVWEGITHFSIGRATINRGQVSVEAHLELVEAGKTYAWTDRVILDRSGDSWVVSNIEYAGGGSLLASIQAGLKQVALELEKHP